MLEKLEGKIDTLVREGRIKTKWSEIEDHGIAELVHLIFGYDFTDESIATTSMVENNTVCLHMCEGVMYEHEGKLYNITRAYIDADSNIIFETPGGELFLYETDKIDAEDPKHYFGNE